MAQTAPALNKYGKNTVARHFFTAFITAVLLFIGAGTRMLHFRSYRLALFASMLAIAPTSPAWPLSLPFGIYSLARLASRKIRREFEIEKQSLAA